MLKQVRYGWITSVLEQSLNEEVRIALGLARRLDVLQPEMRIRRAGQKPKLLPAGTSVSEMFDLIGGRGLLILGAPGSGKTTALLELTRDLLDRAKADQTQPIPVVFNLSSWATKGSAFGDWLIEELRTSYRVSKQIATHWVDEGKILPLLDGLDEVATAHRAECVQAINAFHEEQRAKNRLVRFAVCSRTEEYKALAAALQVEEALELQPPTLQQVIRYLEAGGDALAGVRAAVDADETLREFLASPLLLNIVALTYHDRPADTLRTASSREELLEELFNEYTDRMFERRRGRYTEAQVRPRLVRLARSMRQVNPYVFDLDRITPEWLPTKVEQELARHTPIVIAVLVVGLVTGLVAGLLSGPAVGRAIGLFAGVVVALVFGLGAGLIDKEHQQGQMVEQVRWVDWTPEARVHVVEGARKGALRGGVLGTLGAALIFGLLSWFRSGSGVTLPGGLGLAGALISRVVGGLSGPVGVLVGALAFGLVSALVGALLGAVSFGLVNAEVKERSTPNEGIRRSARYGCFYGVGFGLVLGLVDGPIVGQGVMLAAGLRFGWLNCLRHLVVRGLLVRNGVVPWRCVDFLDWAKELLFLRRTGSGYIFVHRMLLEHFAGMDTTDPPTTSEAATPHAEPPSDARPVHIRGQRQEPQPGFGYSMVS